MNHPIDIKERLLSDGPWHDYDDMCEEAAAEIERLQGELAACHSIMRQHGHHTSIRMFEANAEIAALKQERDAAREAARCLWSVCKVDVRDWLKRWPWLEETE